MWVSSLVITFKGLGGRIEFFLHTKVIVEMYVGYLFQRGCVATIKIFGEAIKALPDR